MSPYFQKQLDQLKKNDLYRCLKLVESDQGPEIKYQGRTLLNFSSNNYLGLANHPRLKEASIDAIKKYGTGSGASRLITGSMSLHKELENRIAQFKGTEKALVFNSGYHANLGIIFSLAGERDHIFSDQLNHASLIDGCRLSRASIFVYRHNSVEHLEELLNHHPPSTIHHPRLIITDTLFSMDGDLCPLPQIIKLAEKYDAWVLVDEAHATGVYGENGRGIVEHFKISSRHPRLIQMGTFGKALGSFGAYVCGSQELIDYLINTARSFIYTTSLPPSVLAATLEAIQLIEEDESFRKKLWENIDYFKWGLEALGEKCVIHAHCDKSPIFPLIIGDEKKTMDLADRIFDEGIWAHGIRPPTVPHGTSRIRLALMATHTREHLDRCLEVLGRVLYG